MRYMLQQCLSDTAFHRLRIATGYWDIPGMVMILDELEAFFSRPNASLQLLIGKDPYAYASLMKHPKYKDATYPNDFIRTDIHELEVKEEYERVIALLLQYGETGQLQVRIYKQNEQADVEFLHAKCYIFSAKEKSYGIIGSSNFTQKGLSGNAELNYLETNSTCVTAEPKEGSASKGHVFWFEEKWALSQDWTQEFLEQVLRKSPNAPKAPKVIPFTPYEQYIKLLQMRYGDLVDQQLGQRIESYLPIEFRKLSYQIDAVKQCFSIMHEHGGFILADVVGLGKTIVGTLVAKHFLSSPEEEGREHKVLVVSPPAILPSWKDTIAEFDKECEEKIAPNIDFITTGSIGQLLGDEVSEDIESEIETDAFATAFETKNYGLILIDESHKFRHSNTSMYQSLDNLIQKISSNTGLTPFVGLLSATPQNNRPDDLKNQIYLFERNHRDSTLKKACSGNIEEFFAKVKTEYNLLIGNKEDLSALERSERLDKLSRQLRDCILDDLLVRRTRYDVKKYYADDLKQQGIVFPEIQGPTELEYIMDDELAELFYDTIRIIAPLGEEEQRSGEVLNYLRYRAIQYFKSPKHTAKYQGAGNLDTSRVANQLAGIMQMLLVKRLESSFSAFKESLLNLKRYTQNMVDMWQNNTIFVCPQINVNEELNKEAKSSARGRAVTFDDCVEDIRKKIAKLTQEGRNDKGQNAEYTREDFQESYYTELLADLELIEQLCQRWSKDSEDPKFDAFKDNLKHELFDPQKNTSQKLVIFTEAISTAHALERAVKNKGFRPLMITAANRDEKKLVIRENFDANYKGEWKDDYNVIITTEVLAEGVNLHRANVILNYDTPWNATRLMQRIGRVNRIGSREPVVYVYNFMPSAQGDRQINLVKKAHTKLQSFHVLFGEDSKIFTNAETVVHYEHRKPWEEQESPSQQYVYELKQYKSSHPLRYEEIASTSEGWEIAQCEEGTAYFFVKAAHASLLPIKITHDEDTSYHSTVMAWMEVLEEMRPSEAAQRVELPAIWPTLREEATHAYVQHFVRISKMRAGGNRDKALGVISQLYNAPHISAASKKLLKEARKIVDKGNQDLIRQFLYIDKELNNEMESLFELTQETIDKVLSETIQKLVERNQKQQGTANILLATLK